MQIILFILYILYALVNMDGSSTYFLVGTIMFGILTIILSFIPKR